VSFESNIADLVDEYKTSTKYRSEPMHGVVYDLRHETSGPGLYQQLAAALGQQTSRVDSDRVKASKPGSKAPPGWRVDVSDLLADIDTRTRARMAANSWTRPVPTVEALRWLAKAGIDDAELAQDVSDWRRLARLTLGFQTPSIGLPSVGCQQRRLVPGGFVAVGCGEASLRVARDAETAVFCASATCHDDVDFPDCRELDGRLTCRRSERDLRHCFTWPAETWAILLTANSEDVA
jgi:hypothetical protein